MRLHTLPWLDNKLCFILKSPASLRPPFKKFLPGIAWFLFVLFLICIPGKDLPEASWLPIPDADKLVHMGMFGGIVFWFCWPFTQTDFSRKEKIRIFLQISLATCVWGFMTELIQRYFITNRTFDLMDWVADMAGVGLSFIVCKRWFVGKVQSWTEWAIENNLPWNNPFSNPHLYK